MHSPRSRLIIRSWEMTSLLRLNGERLGCRLSNRGTTPENALLYFFFFLPKSYLRVTQYVRTHPMHIDCPFGRFNQYLPGLSQPRCRARLPLSQSLACTCLRNGLLRSNEKKAFIPSPEFIYLSSLISYLLSLFSWSLFLACLVDSLLNRPTVVFAIWKKIDFVISKVRARI